MRVILAEHWQCRQEGDNTRYQVILIAVAAGPPMQDTDHVVDTFHRVECDVMVRIALRGDAVPQALKNAGKLAVGFRSRCHSKAS